MRNQIADEPVAGRRQLKIAALVTLACAATLLGFRLSGLCDEWVMVTPTHPQTQASIGSGEHSGSSRPQPAEELNAIYARGMMVVGVAEDREGAITVAPFVERHAIRYPELLADAATLERL